MNKTNKMSQCIKFKPVTKNDYGRALMAKMIKQLEKNYQEDFKRLISLQYVTENKKLTVFENDEKTFTKDFIIFSDSYSKIQTSFLGIIQKGFDTSLFITHIATYLGLEDIKNMMSACKFFHQNLNYQLNVTPQKFNTLKIKLDCPQIFIASTSFKFINHFIIKEYNRDTRFTIIAAMNFLISKVCRETNRTHVRITYPKNLSIRDYVTDGASIIKIQDFCQIKFIEDGFDTTLRIEGKHVRVRVTYRYELEHIHLIFE